MRTMFTNSMVAHVWAQMNQPHGRNSSSSMHFDGSVAYSYRQPVAHIVRTPRGETVALFTSEKFSVTTSGHVTDYRRAASQYPAFTVPDLLLGQFHTDSLFKHDANLAYFKARYEKERDALMRAPAWRLNDRTLRELAHQQTDYCDAFGITAPGLPWKADADAAITRRDRLLADPKRQARIRKNREAREAREQAARERALADCQEAISRWRAGEDVHLPWAATRDALGGAMLRVRGDTVQTSLGAEAPVSDVRRAFALYNRLPRGESWQRNGENCRLGRFQLDSIDKDGNARAGCHFITAAEIAALQTCLNEVTT
jgi:hypothetical protein